MWDPPGCCQVAGGDWQLTQPSRSPVWHHLPTPDMHTFSLPATPLLEIGLRHTCTDENAAFGNSKKVRTDLSVSVTYSFQKYHLIKSRIHDSGI